MRAIFESSFDIIYLILVITLGIRSIKFSKNFKEGTLFGWMAVVLGCGDAFHLVPRVIALLSNNMSGYTALLGIGKLITSITMTIFYLMLYHVYKIRYKENNSTMTMTLYALSITRIVLCLMPQNEWTSSDPPLAWGIYRNIPFVILGIMIIVLFINAIKKYGDKAFHFMPLAIILSFAFYIPVVLFADIYPMVGMLMIPKTIAYVWIVWMGYKDIKDKVTNFIRA